MNRNLPRNNYQRGAVRVYTNGVAVEATGDNADKIADAASAMLLMFGLAALIAVATK